MFGYIEDWQKSGESKKSYCKKHRIAPSVFHYWYVKYKQQNEDKKSSSNFISLNVEPVVGSRTSPLMEISYTDGTQIRIYQQLDINLIKALLPSY